MENLKERVGNRKVIATILLVCTIAFALAYASMRTETGFAVFTKSPPGIPGLFYVTAEATIYGDTVDLASIKSTMNGTYADDHTYVQWGVNPFYRVYADSTFQEVFSGKLIDVLNQFSGACALAYSLPGIDKVYSLCRKIWLSCLTGNHL